MTTLVALRGQIVKPAGVATVSPFIDMDPARKLRHRNVRRCSMFTCGALSAFAQFLSQAQL